MSSEINKEKTSIIIKEIIEKIKTEADPYVLNEYRSLIRKEVPFLSRTYFAAYLLMQAEQSGQGRFTGRSRKSGKGSGTTSVQTGDDTSRSDTAKYPLPEEESTRLFISIGRNRRVFPREILGLISAKTSVAKEDIGAIRILDNYSFIQVRTTAADEIIEALNGKQFRGRTLAVNYARAKNDEIQDPDTVIEETAE